MNLDGDEVFEDEHGDPVRCPYCSEPVGMDPCPHLLLILDSTFDTVNDQGALAGVAEDCHSTIRDAVHALATRLTPAELKALVVDGPLGELWDQTIEITASESGWENDHVQCIDWHAKTTGWIQYLDRLSSKELRWAVFPGYMGGSPGISTSSCALVFGENPEAAGRALSERVEVDVKHLNSVKRKRGTRSRSRARSAASEQPRDPRGEVMRDQNQHLRDGYTLEEMKGVMRECAPEIIEVLSPVASRVMKTPVLVCRECGNYPTEPHGSHCGIGKLAVAFERALRARYGARE